MIRLPRLENHEFSVAGMMEPGKFIQLPQYLLTQESTLVDGFETGWAAWGGSGTAEANTSEFVEGTRSMKLTSPVGAAGIMQKDVVSWDWTNEATDHFTMSIYCHSNVLTTLVRVQLNVAPINTWARYAATSRVSYWLQEGWNTWHFSKADFSLYNGMTWAEGPIVIARVMVYPTTGQTAVVSFDNLRVGAIPIPALFLSFDDGYDDAYQVAWPIMKQYNMVGTCFMQTSTIDVAGHMTQANGVEMEAAGWDWANHTQNHTNLTTLSEAQQETEIAAGREDLITRGFVRGANHLAYPFGTWNADTLTACAAVGVLTARTAVESAHPPIPAYLPQSIYKVVGENASVRTFAQLKVLVDNAVSRKAILSIYMHTFGVGAVTQEDFNTFITYCHTLKLQTLTISQMYNLYSGSITGRRTL